jgi:Recombination endonuclease VII
MLYDENRCAASQEEGVGSSSWQTTPQRRTYNNRCPVELNAGQKWCARCQSVKSVDDFWKNKATKSGIHPHCKKCVYPDNQKRKTRAVMRATHLRKSYGLSLSDFQAMLDKQKGACLICLCDLSPKACVDHCHSTGAIRGLLCDGCNNGLGRLKDSPALLRRAAEYLESSGHFDGLASLQPDNQEV